MTWTQGELEAVLRHMSVDHPDDSLLIAQAFGRPRATASEMVGLDHEGGVWWVETVDEAGGDASELRVPWPSGRIAERSEIRREVVTLYGAACDRLGVPRRPH